MATTALVILASGANQDAMPSSLYVRAALPFGEAPATTMRPASTSARPVKRPAHRRSVDLKALALFEAKRAGIKNPQLFLRQMMAESGLNICAVSPAGAAGVAQVMPETAKSWGVEAYDFRQALRISAQNMARYEKQLGSFPVALAAYNAGPGAVQKYNGIPPYPETQRYIEKIMGDEEIWVKNNGILTFPTGYTPEFSKRLNRLMRRVEARGGSVRVVSGFRSYQKQVKLWREGKRKHGDQVSRWVAPPGCSRHNHGLAADLAGDLKLAHRLAPAAGLKFPLRHEPWHVEMY